MIGRFGFAISWLFTGLALLVIAFGIRIAQVDAYNPVGETGVFVALGFCIWLFGRGFRYVLSGK